MRPLLEPRLVDPTAREPGLVIDVRDERRALLFDLGEIARLSPRVLLRASHAFVTHTHTCTPPARSRGSRRASCCASRTRS